MSCKDLFSAKAPYKQRTLNESWAQSVNALQKVNQNIYGRPGAIEALTTAILANEFVWINGEPGGAKTYLSRMMFKSVLNTITEKDKKIFILQFHKLVSEGKISGFQKFSSMMKEGKYEIETESSLVGDKFLFLIADEAEKSNPAVLNALLSVINERKAFLGARVVDAVLSSGVFTSNKTTGEFIAGFLNDRPSGEALLDRMAIKIHMPNQQTGYKETVAMFKAVEKSKEGNIDIDLPLMDLQKLMDQIEVPDQLMTEVVSIVREFDQFVTNKADESRTDVRYGEKDAEYFQANQFSNRSVRRLVQTFKASFIAKQLMEGVIFENMSLKPERSDLHLLSQSALYIGPFQLKPKTYSLTVSGFSMRAQSEYGSISSMDVMYNPHKNEIELQDGQGKTQLIYEKQGNYWQHKWASSNYENWEVINEDFKGLAAAIKKISEDYEIDPKKPQFEIHSDVAALLAKGTIKKRTREELESIQEDLRQFVTVLNRHLEMEPKEFKSGVELSKVRDVKEQRSFRRKLLDKTTEERLEESYGWMSYEIQTLKERFIELEHSIEAHLTGILSSNHLYVFGPPGGAKTALAEVILQAELKSMNQSQVDQFVRKTIESMKGDESYLHAVLSRMKSESPKQFDRFLLQFHKLLPEGVLIGFPKVEKQLDKGIEEIDVSTSLANEKFVFSILDEVDKANPQTVTALLSLLNEREVFVGNQVIKTALKTAILTSNKMPSELLDSYYEDRSAGEAVMDRAVNKVFVSNKISSEEALVQFLVNLEKGISPSWKGLLSLNELEPLVGQVKFESPVIEEILTQTHAQFLSSRIKKQEESFEAHKMDEREFPDYYVSATESASDRTVIRLLEQLKSRFIVNQLMNGVTYKDLRTTIELKDLGLFFEGLGYWAPQKITHSYDKDGYLQFKNESGVLEGLIGGGFVDQRVKYHLEMILDEAKDFTKVLNHVTGAYMKGYREEVGQHPELFPSFLNKSEAAGEKTHLSEERKVQIDEGIQALAKLRLDLDVAQVKAEDSPVYTSLSSDYTAKETQLLEYLRMYNIMTRSEYLEKIKEEILVLQNESHVKNVKSSKEKEDREQRKREQEEKIKESVIDGSRIVMQRIEPGNFKMGENLDVPVTLTKPFEIAATQTTQVVWKGISDIINKELSGKYELNPDPSNFKGDLKPVEQVSWEDVNSWLKGLNELSKDSDTNIQEKIKELIPRHKKGDEYGLPTEAHWEFVIRGRGQNNEKYHFGNDQSKLIMYAHYRENSNNQAQEVATKDPITIEGKEIYDLHGNVSEWVHDWYEHKLSGGTDPSGPAGGSNRVMRGGSWGSNARNLRSSYRFSASPGDRLIGVGFRLVRMPK